MSYDPLKDIKVGTKNLSDYLDTAALTMSPSSINQLTGELTINTPASDAYTYVHGVEMTNRFPPVFIDVSVSDGTLMIIDANKIIDVSQEKAFCKIRMEYMTLEVQERIEVILQKLMEVKK